MRRTLEGMAIVITGASAGIGRALAEVLAPRGAKLVLAARRIDRLHELQKSLAGEHLAVAADVSREDDCRRLVDESAARFGRIDTLVCNAGYGFLRPVATTPRLEFEQIFATNVLGTADCIRFAAPIMARQEPREGYRGQVMIVSSVVARRGLPYFGAYSATKAAQLALAEALRVELRPEAIAVTVVLPAGTDTEFGNASAAQSGGQRPNRIRGEPRQSAQVVARKMAAAIERPRPELWPLRIAHWGVGVGMFVPSLLDRILSKRREQLAGEEAN